MQSNVPPKKFKKLKRRVKASIKTEIIEIKIEMLDITSQAKTLPGCLCNFYKIN